MVERVARALALPSGAFPYERIAQNKEAKDALFDMARAAIAAMREPTGAMVDAADNVRIVGADLHDFTAYGCATPVWQAMIDEALRTE